MNVAWSQGYLSYKKWWQQKLTTEFTVLQYYTKTLKIMHILGNNKQYIKQYIKLIQTESGLLSISLLISL